MGMRWNLVALINAADLCAAEDGSYREPEVKCFFLKG